MLGKASGAVVISCVGAQNITDPIIIDGDWKLEVDGELVRPDATNIDDVIAYLTEAGFEVTIEDVPPVISCEGADNYTEVHFFKEIGSDEISPPIVKIDGVVINAPPAWLAFSEVAAVPPPEGFEFDGSIKYTNTDSINHRIEMDQQSASKRLVLINPSNTVVEFEEYKHYGVCLSPAEIVEPPWDIKFVDSGETVYRLIGSSIPNNYADNAPAGNIGTEYIDVTSLTIGNTVNSIGSTAFRGWQNAQELIIEEGLSSIGDYAFYFWSSITQVVIPASVTHIGANAFGYWESCNSFTFLSTTPPTIGDTIIHSVAPNTKIYVPASAVDTYKNDAGWSFYANDIFAIQ